MALAITHPKVATEPQDSGSEVSTDEWNATHKIILDGLNLVGKPDAGNGPAVEVGLDSTLQFSGGNLGIAVDWVDGGGASADWKTTGDMELGGNAGFGSAPSTIYRLLATRTNSSGLGGNVVRAQETLTAANANFPGTIVGLGLVDGSAGAAAITWLTALEGELRVNDGYTGTWNNANITNFKFNFNATGNPLITSLRLFSSNATSSSGAIGRITNLIGMELYDNFTGAITVQDFWGFRVRGLSSTSNSFTRWTGGKIFNPTGTGTYTTVKGLEIEDLTKGSTNYAINLKGTAGEARQGLWFNTTENIHRSATNELTTSHDWKVGGKLGVNVSTIVGQAHIDQSSPTAAIPVMHLDQADVSEEFLRLTGAAGSGILTQSLVAAGDVVGATLAGYLKINVQDVGNQITDGPYYIPFYGSLVD